MIQKHLLNVQIQWMMFMEILNSYNPNRNRKKLIIFDDMIADITTLKKFQSIIKDLFIRCGKPNISLVFISDYRTFKELFRDLYYRTITTDEAESKQDEFNTIQCYIF